LSDLIFEQYATAMATLNTALQGAFGRDGNRLFLLKREGKSKQYSVVSELLTGWRVEYGATRDEIFLYYSTIADYGDTFACTTHIGFGVADVTNHLFLYEIQPNQKERTTADFWEADWKAFAIRVQNDRYSIPGNLTYNGDYLVFEGNRLKLTV